MHSFKTKPKEAHRLWQRTLQATSQNREHVRKTQRLAKNCHAIWSVRTYLLLRHLHRFNTHLLSQLMSPEPRRNFIFSERGNKSLSEPLLGILMHSRAYRLVSMLGLTSVSPLSCVIFQLLDFLFQPANLICHLAHPRVGVIPTKPARAVILSPTAWETAFKNKTNKNAEYQEKKRSQIHPVGASKGITHWTPHRYLQFICSQTWVLQIEGGNARCVPYF